MLDKLAEGKTKRCCLYCKGESFSPHITFIGTPYEWIYTCDSCLMIYREDITKVKR